MDIGISRMLLTFLLQYVLNLRRKKGGGGGGGWNMVAYHSNAALTDCQTRENRKAKLTISVSG